MERFAIKIDECAPVDLRKLCRLCGTHNTAKIQVLQKTRFFEDGEPELWKKISACVGIKVTKNDKMPQSICLLCHDKILDFFEFREMCSSINVQTRRLLGLSNQIRKKEDLGVKVEDKLSNNKRKPNKRQLETESFAFLNTKKSKLIKTDLDEIDTKNNLLMPQSSQQKKKSKNKINKILQEEITTSKKRKAAPTKSKAKKQLIDIKTDILDIVKCEDPQVQVQITDEFKNNVVCTICEQPFKDIELDDHLKIVHVPKVVPYHCIKCNEIIIKKSDIKSHNLWHKLSKTPFVCGRCDKHIDSLAGYTRHINDCLVFDTSLVEPPRTCLLCEEKFETRNLYFWHYAVVHKMKCYKCHKSFANQADCVTHVQNCVNASSSPTTSIKSETNPISKEVDKAFTEGNACVMIPSSLELNHTEENSLSTVTASSNEKNKKKKLTKKDMQRFDNLLKNAYETLQNIKQETDGQQQTTTTTPNESPSHDVFDGDFQTDDVNDSDEDSQNTPTTEVRVKQEIIDASYKETENNISIATVANSANIEEDTSVGVDNERQQMQSPIDEKPVIKLKIKKEHGTLNSSFIGDGGIVDLTSDDDISSKKKKKKKKFTKGSINVFGQTIKREPIDNEDFSQDESVTCNADKSMNDNHPDDELNIASPFPVISSVSSLVNSSTPETNEELNLPVISSVFSNVVIKQEVLDSDDLSHSGQSGSVLNRGLIIPKSEVFSDEESENINESVDNLSSQTKSIKESNICNRIAKARRGNTLPSNMRSVRIKKEIDYEEYTRARGIRIKTEKSDEEHVTTAPVVPHIRIKQEPQWDYDENPMSYNKGAEREKEKNQAEKEIDKSQDDEEEQESVNKGSSDVESLPKISTLDTVYPFKKILLKNPFAKKFSKLSKATSEENDDDEKSNECTAENVTENDEIKKFNEENVERTVEENDREQVNRCTDESVKEIITQSNEKSQEFAEETTQKFNEFTKSITLENDTKENVEKVKKLETKTSNNESVKKLYKEIAQKEIDQESADDGMIENSSSESKFIEGESTCENDENSFVEKENDTAGENTTNLDKIENDFDNVLSKNIKADGTKNISAIEPKDVHKEKMHGDNIDNSSSLIPLDSQTVHLVDSQDECYKSEDKKEKYTDMEDDNASNASDDVIIVSGNNCETNSNETSKNVIVIPEDSDEEEEKDDKSKEIERSELITNADKKRSLCLAKRNIEIDDQSNSSSSRTNDSNPLLQFCSSSNKENDLKKTDPKENIFEEKIKSRSMENKIQTYDKIDNVKEYNEKCMLETETDSPSSTTTTTTNNKIKSQQFENNKSEHIKTVQNENEQKLEIIDSQKQHSTIDLHKYLVPESSDSLNAKIIDDSNHSVNKETLITVSMNEENEKNIVASTSSTATATVSSVKDRIELTPNDDKSTLHGSRFENINEIAENNNNENIEKELKSNSNTELMDNNDEDNNKNL